ncbi:hypothetical protein C922_05272 [Plasmodium inui San Antonio 1]|uniref:Uncharacterized protein n=1 Tax=Plasmodium inui San Antonio 1 TaxID=1237626 RepID=W6ZYE3_9APIC|nr:hypothetical protein C922_05272 [Plasmodium inui San Antonio 1]EUD64353.1 hypothetical protein C922_05272 [Plasmodium inui San Antonio 1]
MVICKYQNISGIVCNINTPTLLICSKGTISSTDSREDAEQINIIKLYQKETAEHVIYETTNNTSGTNCHKERQEVHNHELCVITDEEVDMEMSIPLFMMLLHECKEQ